MRRQLFQSNSLIESEFLNFLRIKIDDEEFRLLQSEAGFNAPNEFDVENIKRCVVLGEFPNDDFYEYLWAIYECGWENLRRYSPWMRACIASFYIYCNKRRQGPVEVESDYFLLAIEAALETQKPELPARFLDFIEWLHDSVPAAEGYDDYFALLSWGLLQRMAQTRKEDVLRAVLDVLLNKGYSTERLTELTVSDRGIESWLDLHRRLPSAGASIDKDFERIIAGHI